ncbi:MAG: hypothetical protein HPAVJP_3440 [Candidatus Hepatoplasma vulgare]|nr:MAG: hypothetical protein HPAVJP_3440 [Candidatus Hepatoplasma sp.]
MINANFLKKNKSIIEFSISGHAFSVLNENGNDLVCAAASGIVFGILNSLNDKTNEIFVKKNFISIKTKNINDKNNQLILNVLETSLKTLEEKNKKNIKILVKRG